MGNICSRSANEPDSSSARPGPGRVLGSSAAPAAGPPARAPVPANRKIQGAGRTLGGSTGGEPEDAKNMAGEAAQRRAQALNASSKGKLASQLAAQKAQTQSQTLNSASQVERDTRNADSAAEARQWN
ncbi:uncharacterized protein TRUGW13939_03173 [Talaromyces rugulosus]|uniref:Uncharacterized protein n=1 Tax=Talaromyces rugulosus TaxID=121627 RepID=A0A7H8QSH4_TALRU|nr:uncharacterized protein TRUGW13939_03173 [Talaromyces rugulosus]QKX56073.1 hypothetical protein TRUGW13939_03173 [Talaromyces rugulosus]